ncbi:hypothetical protein Tco_0570258 [Tanacetum coccineum]
MSQEDITTDEESDSDSDAESRPSAILEELSKSKPLKKFTYITEIDVVEKVYKDKVKYDKYCLKMLNRRAKGKITKCDVRTRGKSPINLKVYKDNGSIEIIYNFKVSDLHVREWKEVLDGCPKRNGASWNIIYTQMRKKVDDINKTKQELELDLSCPLEEKDPVIKLNLFAKRKRKNVDDLHDYIKSTKRYKKSNQYDDHPIGTVLNEPTLRMILSHAQHRQDY